MNDTEKGGCDNRINEIWLRMESWKGTENVIFLNGCTEKLLHLKSYKYNL